MLADQCWTHTGYVMPNGYGQVRVKQKTMLVHRAVYAELVGPIPEGLDLDHLCRNRACYNPRHLEPVTRSENLRRGISRNREKTTCPAGHPYDVVYPSGSRWCKRCRQAYDKARRSRAR